MPTFIYVADSAAMTQATLAEAEKAGAYLISSEDNHIFIQPPTENYADGTYTLYITSKLKNKNGTELKEPIQMIFTIKVDEE